MSILETNSTENSAKNLASHDEKNDLLRGIAAYQVWGTLGWHDIKQRYRRSVLGPFWFTLSTAILVLVLGALYSTLLNQEIHNYLPYLAVGLVVWQYLAASVTEGCTAFIGSTYLIKQIRLPLTVHVCRIAWRNFAILLHSLPVVVVMLIIFGKWPTIEFLLLPLGLFILLLHGVWLGIVLGVLSARFRDISPIVTNLVQVAFFFTPVMWSPEILKDRAWVAHYNPLYHMIELIRAPITGRPILWESWAWSIGFLVIGFFFAQFLMRRYRNRVPYWL
ncbi:ABC transporter permease [Actimicrobium sp. CCC2.4]|jgi:ABC-2 type transport system permease protein|uniref:ABC transporter permease n=1 Tax=Actimicrobium sp. CCC2.4 TaxID=3048606 RepID=UPI002AC9EC3D|nr:ABC transporter permease [Actimicrobium sp. CCC2.4]MEB0136040.1 ABC transporter permease [Actimicrobium sp. CCC2.4]WPX32201.1 ABC transporter permease [Actimicrobium sp. CCC2.4]